MGELHYFAREKKILIDERNGNICIPGISEEYFIKDDELYIRKCPVSREEQKVKSQKIECGDSIKVAGLIITIYEQFISIEGEKEKYSCDLRPVDYSEIPFEGFPYYKKSPRVIHRIHPETIKVKNPPRKESMSKGSLAQIIVPPLTMMVVTIFMSIFMKRGLYVIASVCMTAVTFIFSIQKFFNERKEIKQKNKKREQVYTDYLVRLRARIRRLRRKEREALDYQVPEAEQLEKMAVSYDSRLYERSTEDEDFLQVSLGYQDGESKIVVDYENDELKLEDDEMQDEAKRLVDDFKVLDHIPVTVNLHREHLGIVGEKQNIHNQLKYLIMQLCFSHSYHDLQIVFIGNEEDEKKFSYLRWYPHLRIQAINVIASIFTNTVRDQVLGVFYRS